MAGKTKAELKAELKELKSKLKSLESNSSDITEDCQALLESASKATGNARVQHLIKRAIAKL